MSADPHLMDGVPSLISGTFYQVAFQGIGKQARLDHAPLQYRHAL